MAGVRENARSVAGRMPLNNDEKRRIARAMWSYTGRTQPELNAALGWKNERLRSMLGSGPHSAPTTDELLELAEVAGIPAAIAIEASPPRKSTSSRRRGPCWRPLATRSDAVSRYMT